MQNFSTSSGPVTKADMAEFEATLNQQDPAEGQSDPATLVQDPATQTTISNPNDELEILKKRHADSQRYIAKLKADAAKEKKELLEKLNAAQTPSQKYVSPEALKGFEEAFPDFAPFLKEYNEMTKADAKKYADERIEQALAERDTKAQESTEAVKRLTLRHPDWPEYENENTPGGEIFAKWLSTQSPIVNDMITSGDVEKVILVLDLFKSQGLGAKPTKNSGKQKDLTSAVQASTPTQVATTKASFNMEEWNAKWEKAFKRSNQKLMAELMLDYEQAVKEGRI